MKYTIEWSERKMTSTRKEKIDATLNDGTKTVDKVTIWSDFPNFAGIMTGQDIEGDLVEKQNGQFLNRTLYPIKVQTPNVGSPRGFGGINKAMERKEQGIEKTMDRKEEGIMTSSSIRMAVDCALAEYDHTQEVSLDELILKWRTWFVEKWDINPTDKKAF